MTGILKIADLVEDLAAPRWVEYPGLPGFEVHLRQPDIPAITRLVSQAAAALEKDSLPLPPGKIEAEAKTPTPRVDWINYHYGLLRYAVDGWRRLKVKDLPQLVGRSLKVQGADPDADLAFCPDNLDFLIRHAVSFSNWLSEYVRDWSEEIQRQEVKDKANLSPTPNTTLTPSPAPVRGAKTKK